MVWQTYWAKSDFICIFKQALFVHLQIHNRILIDCIKITKDGDFMLYNF